MACLIIALPIYTADVFAAANEMNVVKYSGQDEVDGFFRISDSWQLEADAKIDGDEQITPDQVKINGLPFNSASCPAQETGFSRCSYDGDNFQIAPGSYSANFSLFSDHVRTVSHIGRTDNTL